MSAAPSLAGRLVGVTADLIRQLPPAPETLAEAGAQWFTPERTQQAA